MSLGKAGQDLMLLWVTVKCDEQGKDSQRHKCDFQPQNYLCCALFFTRLVYGADGVSAVVTVLKRTGQTSLEIWLRYSSVACFLPDVGAILPYLEQLWQSGTVLKHTVLLLKEMQLDLNFLPQTCQTFVIVCCFSDPFPVLF